MKKLCVLFVLAIACFVVLQFKLKALEKRSAQLNDRKGAIESSFSVQAY